MAGTQLGFAGDDAHHVRVHALVFGLLHSIPCPCSRFMSVHGGVAGSRSLFRNRDRYAECKLCKDVDLPVVVLDRCRYRRAENCGAPQLQFVDQVESSLFGNRDMCAQCNCAVFSCQVWCLLDS